MGDDVKPEVDENGIPWCVDLGEDNPRACPGRVDRTCAERGKGGDVLVCVPGVQRIIADRKTWRDAVGGWRRGAIAKARTVAKLSDRMSAELGGTICENCGRVSCPNE